MPELPEVETLCRQLREKICGRKILASRVYDPKLACSRTLKASEVVKVERRGKVINVQLDNGFFIRIHLRMTGRLLWQKGPERPRHSRWRLSFDDGHMFLVDPRRFATVKVENTETDKIKNDLMMDFDEEIFLRKQAGRKVNIKTLLLDPKAVAGIGNIYACEILHGSGVSPFRQAAMLSKEEWKKILTSAKRILGKGIEKRGTSISDWKDLYGRQGENQHELRAYGQEGKSCSMCGGTICRIKQGGRSTFYCPECQK